MSAMSPIDQTLKATNRAARTAFRVSTWGIRQGMGVVERLANRNPAPKPDIDSVTLARKVETEIFREPDAPKASVDVNVVDGIVSLHGQVRRPDDIRAIEARTRAIPEVRGVENLLHLPKTPAPTRADAPARQRRTRSSKRPSTPRTEARRLAADKTPPEAEPAPDTLAREGRGRQPAPLGSHEPGEGEPEDQRPAR